MCSHLITQQRLQKTPVFNAIWTINPQKEGQYLHSQIKHQRNDKHL